jgi:hypothetical protein
MMAMHEAIRTLLAMVYGEEKVRMEKTAADMTLCLFSPHPAVHSAVQGNLLYSPH